jgi:predicted RND superfamily exporter protein
MTPDPSNEDRITQAPQSWCAMMAGRVAGQSASRPWLFLACGALALLLAILSIGRLHIAATLTAMLGTDTKAAAAMDRIARSFRTSDGILILIELPPEHPGGIVGRESLASFSAQLEQALLQNQEARPFIEWIRSGEDPAIENFVRDVVMTNGSFYLSDASVTELLHRLEPDVMQRQFKRNATMIATAGPAAAVLSTQILRDPLRLFELIPRTSLGNSLQDSGDGSAEGSRSAHEHSTDHRAVLLRIGLSHLGSEYETAAPLVDIVWKTASRLNESNLNIRLGGFAPIAATAARVIRRDAIVTCVVAIAMLLVLFRFFYRSWAIGLLIGGIAAVGLVTGLGVAGLFLDEVSPLAAMIATLLAGLGVDYGIHFLSHLQSCRKAGLDKVTASVVAARHMASPLIATCGTTVLGFMSLWFSQIQMLSDFATLGACGLIGSLVAVFLLMPAIVSIINWSPTRAHEKRETGNHTTPWLVRHPMTSVSLAGGLLLALFVGAASQGFDTPIESDLRVMHPSPNLAIDTTAEIIQKFSGQGDFIPIEVNVNSPQELLAAAHRAAAALTSTPCREVGVVQIRGIHQLLPNPAGITRTHNRFADINPTETLANFWNAVNASAFSPEAYVGYGDLLEELITPRTAPSIADVLKRTELCNRFFPVGQRDSTTPPTSTVLIAQLASPIVDRAQRRMVVDTLNQAADGVQGADVIVAGVAAVTLELEDAARSGLPRSAILSLVLVLTWLYLFLRCIRRVLLALLPLAFAGVVVTLFIMATGQQLNPINAIALPLLAGIAVDAGLLLIAATPSRGLANQDSIWRLRATSHAVILSTTTTSLAFFAICFSHTPAIRSLGIVSGFGAMAAGIGAILLLMPILVGWTTGHLHSERAVE